MPRQGLGRADGHRVDLRHNTIGGTSPAPAGFPPGDGSAGRPTSGHLSVGVESSHSAPLSQIEFRD
jgi:hypothetical protein